MKLFTNQRQFFTSGNTKGDYTLGIVQCNFAPYKAFILEDTYRPKKIPGETRHGAGLFKLGLRKELTELTKAHRLAYAKHSDGSWFRANPGWWHIEITGVPDYTGLYVHSGIDDKHTKGCNLPMYLFDMSKLDNPGALSVKATNDFYALVHNRLLTYEEIYWETKDEIK